MVEMPTIAIFIILEHTILNFNVFLNLTLCCEAIISNILGVIFWCQENHQCYPDFFPNFPTFLDLFANINPIFSRISSYVVPIFSRNREQILLKGDPGISLLNAFLVLSIWWKYKPGMGLPNAFEGRYFYTWNPPWSRVWYTRGQLEIGY